ncbi:hypothetical protein C8Q80DRAFT_367608 [Daedaleopsis nitida]|nr:hypothetical protein C8Q80DRAFT_367608 [Daedaleopsis nitida]
MAKHRSNLHKESIKSIATKSPPYIPGEIADQIISHIEDTDSLLSCSLVCREWSYASRHCLFQTIRISSAMYDKFVDAIVHSDRMHSWLSSIDTVEFQDTEALPWTQDESLQEPRPEKRRARNFIFDFAGRLPNLQTLVFDRVDWTQWSLHPRTYLLYQTLPSLQTLSLSHCRFPSFRAIRLMITALPRLEALSLHYVTWQQQERPLETLAHRFDRPKMHFLSVIHSASEDCITDLFVWISQTRSRTSIGALEFSFLQFPEQHVWFLEMLAGSSAITEMNIKLSDHHRYPLMKLEHLTTLHIEGGTSTFNSTWLLTQLLLHLKCRLRHLTISISMGRCPFDFETPTTMVYDLELRYLDPIFEGEMFQDLERVDFRVTWMDYGPASRALGEEVRSAVQRSLPKLHARRVLSVCLPGTIVVTGGTR